MTIVEIRGELGAARDAREIEAHQAVGIRVRKIWPIFVVSVGLLATLAWTALLGWLVYRAALMLLA